MCPKYTKPVHLTSAPSSCVAEDRDTGYNIPELLYCHRQYKHRRVLHVTLVQCTSPILSEPGTTPDARCMPGQESAPLPASGRLPRRVPPASGPAFHPVRRTARPPRKPARSSRPECGAPTTAAGRCTSRGCPRATCRTDFDVNI